MYIPKYYRVQDLDEVKALLSAFPFGTLVAFDGHRPIATHMPFEWAAVGEQLTLIGHVARGNPIWRTAPEMEEALAIFQGPHTYISSSWYEEQNVPTWNYEAIHLSGKVTVMADEEFQDAMKKLLNRYETGRVNGRTWESLDADFISQQMRGIVGLKMSVKRIEAARKMSQNRQDRDFQHIVERLRTSHEAQDQAVSQVMSQIRPELFDERED